MTFQGFYLRQNPGLTIQEAVSRRCRAHVIRDGSRKCTAESCALCWLSEMETKEEAKP